MPLRFPCLCHPAGAPATRGPVGCSARSCRRALRPGPPQESFKTEDDGWVIRDGVVVVIKDSNIPDGTVI